MSEDYPSEQQEQRPPLWYANGEHRDYGLDDISDDVCPVCGHAHPSMRSFDLNVTGTFVLAITVGPDGTMRCRSGLHPFDTVAVLQELIEAVRDPDRHVAIVDAAEDQAPGVGS